MLSHEKMVKLHAEQHVLIETNDFQSKNEYVQHLIHTYAYSQACRLVAGKKVLDLGCNIGYGCELLSAFAREVVGVDVSEKAVMIAKQKYGHLGIHFQEIDGKRLPFEDDEFDMIVSCQVVEHIVDYDVYFGEMRRVLAPGGIVFLTTPNANLRLDPGMKPWNRFHVREYLHDELESLLGDFFPAVGIWGLFAKEPLYSIEKDRLDRARKNARTEFNLRSVLRAALPDFLLKRIRKMMVSQSAEVPGVDTAFIDEHGLQDFFYRSDNMLEALDLLAVCSNDEDGLQGTLSMFPS